MPYTKADVIAVVLFGLLLKAMVPVRAQDDAVEKPEVSGSGDQYVRRIRRWQWFTSYRRVHRSNRQAS